MKNLFTFISVLLLTLFLALPVYGAGSDSDYLEDATNDHILGGGDYTRPATVYFALFTVAPTDAGGGTEATGGSYARVAVTNNATNFPASSGGLKSNGTAITFPAPTADWGTIVAVGVYDASTSGNLLYWDDFTGEAVDNGDPTTIIKVGDFDVQR